MKTKLCCCNHVSINYSIIQAITKHRGGGHACLAGSVPSPPEMRLGFSYYLALFGTQQDIDEGGYIGNVDLIVAIDVGADEAAT